jgi:hypothetical protein
VRLQSPNYHRPKFQPFGGDVEIHYGPLVQLPSELAQQLQVSACLGDRGKGGPQYESTRNTIYKLGKISTGSPFSRLGFALLSLFVFGTFKTGQGPMTEEIIWQGTFDGKFEDKHHAIEVFNRHNEEVQRRVPQEQLLVYEVKQGWGPLCAFLGVEEPDKPFPRFNDAAEMRRRVVAMRAASLAVPAALVLVVIAVLVLLGRHARA